MNSSISLCNHQSTIVYHSWLLSPHMFGCSNPCSSKLTIIKIWRCPRMMSTSNHPVIMNDFLFMSSIETTILWRLGIPSVCGNPQMLKSVLALKRYKWNKWNQLSLYIMINNHQIHLRFHLYLSSLSRAITDFNRFKTINHVAYHTYHW